MQIQCSCKSKQIDLTKPFVTIAALLCRHVITSTCKLPHEQYKCQHEILEKNMMLKWLATRKAYVISYVNELCN